MSLAEIHEDKYLKANNSLDRTRFYIINKNLLVFKVY